MTTDFENYKYLISRNIPYGYYQNRSISEIDFIGDDFLKLLANPKEFEKYFTENPILNFYSVIDSENAQMLVARALLVKKIDGFVTDPLSLMSMDAETLDAHTSSYFLAIKDFYISDYEVAPFDIPLRYKLERILNDYLHRGGKLILSTDTTVSNIKWYSSKFLGTLKRLGRDVNLDSGERLIK